MHATTWDNIALELLSLARVAGLGYVGYWLFANAERVAMGQDPVVHFARRSSGMAILVLGVIAFLIILVFWK